MEYEKIRRYADLAHIGRSDHHAQWEIRALAIKIYLYLAREAPSVFSDFSVVTHPTAGRCLVKG